MSSTFYVYEHTRKDTDKVFYVGKGQGKRAHSTHHRNQYWHNIVNKAKGFLVSFVCKDIDEELALLVEIERIDQFKKLGYKLCNLTEGGDGSSGYKHTKESLQKIGQASKAFMTGRVMSKETKAKLSAAKVGKKLTDEHKEKIRLSLLGNKRAAGNTNRTGIKHTEETKQKISASNRKKGLK